MERPRTRPATATEGPIVGSTLRERFAERLDRDPDLIPARSKLLVALSGGSDSLALLVLLSDVAPARGLRLEAAHFDHGTRRGSRMDAERARAAADDLGVSCTVGRANGPLAGQAAFRAARFEFLDRIAAESGSDRIALAHQLDDQLETVMLRLMRGTGLRGLAGIPARRGPYVRPLLEFRREELRQMLKARGVEWSSDPSNRDRRHARARVRHEVLPALRAVSEPEEPDGTLAGLAAGARAADRRLDAWVAKRAGPHAHLVARRVDGPAVGAQIARPPLQDYDPAALARLVRLLARQCGSRLTRGGTRLAVQFMRRGLSGHAVDPGGGLRLSREYDRLVLSRPGVGVQEDDEVVIPARAQGGGRAVLGGRSYDVSWGRPDGSPTGLPAWTIDMDPRAVRFPLRLRAPRPGDRIRTSAGSQKLKKLLNERRVPRSRRPQVPVLETADGDIVWVAGCASAPGDSSPGASFTIGVGVRDGGD